MMNLQLVLATLLLLSPAVYGCLVFQAEYSYDECEKDHIQLHSSVIHDGELMCWYKGGASHDKLYHYFCKRAHHEATFDPSCDKLHYRTEHGSWDIKAKKAGKDRWVACDFGCSEEHAECWVLPHKSRRCDHRDHHHHDSDLAPKPDHHGHHGGHGDLAPTPDHHGHHEHHHGDHGHLAPEPDHHHEHGHHGRDWNLGPKPEHHGRDHGRHWNLAPKPQHGSGW